jgi:UDP:flavonoid glycosyltransferase YjiC (YdhE family)
VPHAADQTRQAQGVARTGVGLWMPAKEATVAGFVEGLARLLPDLSPARAAAQQLKAEFAALGGAFAAADLLEVSSKSR